MAPAGGGTLKKTQPPRKQISNTRGVGGVIYQGRFTKTSSRFNDSVTADVILTLHFEPGVLLKNNGDDVKLYLHSDVLLARSRYFSALFSDRWQTRRSVVDDDGASISSDSSRRNNVVEKKAITFNVPSSMGSFVDTMTIFELFYSTDDDFPEAINSVSSALSIIDAALLLLFEDCVKACIRYLEAVSWNKEEEEKVLSLIHFLQSEESQKLLARCFPLTSTNSCNEMLLGMVMEAVNPEHSNLASSKAFVAKFLRDFPSRDSVRCALTLTFEASLKVLKALLEDHYSRSSFLTNRDNVQRVVMSQAKHIRWLIEMMIEMGVGENAVKEWTDQNYLTDDVIKFFREDRWKNNAAALEFVAHVIRCTCKLAIAVATGLILADIQVSMKLVKNWLPVLIGSKGEVFLPKTNIGKVLPIFANDESVYSALEKAFLRIIWTLPMTDSQELLKQCISLSALNAEENPHLSKAFTTWFRQARLNHRLKKLGWKK